MKVEHVDFYLYNEELGIYEGASSKNGLRPQDEVFEWALSEEKISTIPIEQSLVTVIPLKIHKHKVGVICAESTDSMESLNQTLLDMLHSIATQASAAYLSSRLLSKTEAQASLLNNILDSIINGILTIDRNNVITGMNRNAMAMMEIPQEAVGKKYTDALPRQISIIMEEIVEETTKTGFAMERMMNYNMSMGTEIPLSVSTSLLRDELLSITGIVFVFRDMTASRELERLRQIDKMKTEFISNVSHELKTPLTSIKAYTEALQDMAQDDTQKEFLKVIQEESDRLLFLINDLLNVARLQSGKMKIKFALVQPAIIVNEIMNISKVQSPKHKIIVEADETLPPIYMDRDLMKEVMINLLSNAIKYSPKGGNVWVRIKKFEDNIRYEVQDEGIGIAEELLPKVFEAFYRVDSSMTTEIPGTGLGLSIVKEIVDAHSGKVEVTSKVGVGTTFIVNIPAKTQTTELKPEEESWSE
jgi:PAS domain S-box-containing protein